MLAILFGPQHINKLDISNATCVGQLCGSWICESLPYHSTADRIKQYSEHMVPIITILFMVRGWMMVRGILHMNISFNGVFSITGPWVRLSWFLLFLSSALMIIYIPLPIHGQWRNIVFVQQLVQTNNKGNINLLNLCKGNSHVTDGFLSHGKAVLCHDVTMEHYRTNIWKSGPLSRHLSCEEKRMMTSNGNMFRVTGTLWGEPPVTGGFPSQVTQSFGDFFENGWANKRDAGDLQCHRDDYDVTVMGCDWNDSAWLNSRGIWLIILYRSQWPPPCFVSMTNQSTLHPLSNNKLLSRPYFIASCGDCIICVWPNMSARKRVSQKI